eukprot:scaffold55329_cov63-Phaeocystis_antarctica.AAC.3
MPSAYSPRPIHHHHRQRSHRRAPWASWARSTRGQRSPSLPRTPRKWRTPWGASAPQLVESGPSSQFWQAQAGPAVACAYALRSRAWTV